MNEERLINAVLYRKELEEELKFHRDCDNREIVQGLEIAIADLGDAPTVDAARVVHGRWIYKPFEGDPSLWLYHCSECDTPNANERNYCQYCGAKMDRER